MWTASQTRGTPTSSQPCPASPLSPRRLPGQAGPRNPFSVPQCQDPAGRSREPAPGPRSPSAPRLLAGAPPHPGRRLGKVPQERWGPGVQGGGPEPAGCWPSLPGLTAGLPAGKGEEQALAAAVLGLLCVQLGPGPKGEEFFHSLQPLLVSVLSDSAASPAARLHVSVLVRATPPAPHPSPTPPPGSPCSEGEPRPAAESPGLPLTASRFTLLPAVRVRSRLGLLRGRRRHRGEWPRGPGGRAPRPRLCP